MPTDVLINPPNAEAVVYIDYYVFASNIFPYPITIFYAFYYAAARAWSTANYTPLIYPTFESLFVNDPIKSPIPYTTVPTVLPISYPPSGSSKNIPPAIPPIAPKTSSSPI